MLFIWLNVTKKIANRATGIHLNKPGHNLANLKITIVEKLKTDDGEYRKERETFLINKFNTYYRGINRMP